MDNVQNLAEIMSKGQPQFFFKNQNAQINVIRMCRSNLLTNSECAKTFSGDNFKIIGQARTSFYLNVLEFFCIKTNDPDLYRQKEFVFSLGLSAS